VSGKQKRETLASRFAFKFSPQVGLRLPKFSTFSALKTQLLKAGINFLLHSSAGYSLWILPLHVNSLVAADFITETPFAFRIAGAIRSCPPWRAPSGSEKH
jgi:hypothetical protein